MSNIEILVVENKKIQFFLSMSMYCFFFFLESQAKTGESAVNFNVIFTKIHLQATAFFLNTICS